MVMKASRGSIRIPVSIKEGVKLKNLSDIEKNIINEANQISDINSKYEYIYDKLCDMMDEEFREKNYCDFQNDACICQRNRKTLHSDMGCCYTFKYSKIMSVYR